MPPERKGFDMWKTDLEGARYVVAPMVESSELPWRILSRRHNAQLCYTPMFHASNFVRDARYRRDNFITCPEDQPLIVQFCANDPEIFLEAARHCVGRCAAVDLNLGCPQSIAKRGHYGAFLQDEWELVHSIVNRAYKELSVPITCKMRVFDSLQRTVDYAKMLENAGCQLLTVHGRTREQKGPFTGLAKWEYITEVRKSLSIPVFANGNIQNLEDVERCIQETGVQGVMSAEGNLHNPALFEGKSPTVWSVALEYLDIVKQYPCPLSYTRGHLFKLFQHCLTSEHADLRLELAKTYSVDGFISVTNKIRDRYQDVRWDPEDGTSPPVWICQPYVRPPPEVAMERMQKGSSGENCRSDRTTAKRPLDSNGVELSKKKMKRMARNPRKNYISGEKREKLEHCAKCHNPKGIKCVFSLCRICCKNECYFQNRDCEGHKFLIKTKRAKYEEKAASNKRESTLSSDVPVTDEQKL